MVFVNIAILVWASGATMVCLVSQNQYLAYLIFRYADIGVTFVSPFVLHMVVSLTNYKKKIFLILAYSQATYFSLMLIFYNSVTAYAFERYYGNVLISLPGKIYFLWFGFWAITLSYAHFLLMKYYVKLKIDDKTKIKLLFIAILCGVVCGTANFFYFLNNPITQFANFGIVIYCLILTYAIFKHQILGIEVIYKKGLVYSLLITILTSTYLLLIMFLEWLFRGFLGYHSLSLSLTSAFIIAILFNPLRNKLQTLIDRIFLGKTREDVEHENNLLRQELERSDRLKAASILALGLSHEIRNPLTTIKTFSEYLPEKYKDEEFIRKFSKLVPSEVERINNIIHRLLDFSKPAPLSFQNIKICQLMDDILEFLNSEFLKHHISIEKNYEMQDLEIKIDQSQIKQVLLNIILNAIQAMPNGGKITIGTASNKEGSLQISIADTGCGIAREDLKHIFDPFFTTKDTGSGLGLSIVHQIIKNHNGLIQAESAVARGTTFRIELPIN